MLKKGEVRFLEEVKEEDKTFEERNHSPVALEISVSEHVSNTLL